MGGKQTLGTGKAAHGCSVKRSINTRLFSTLVKLFKKLMENIIFSKNILRGKMIKLLNILQMMHNILLIYLSNQNLAMLY